MSLPLKLHGTAWTSMAKKIIQNTATTKYLKRKLRKYDYGMPSQ